MLVGLGRWVRVRMEDQKRERENRIGSAFTSLRPPYHREERRVVDSVAVTVGKFHFALILLLVNPIDDVLMAIL